MGGAANGGGGSGGGGNGCIGLRAGANAATGRGGGAGCTGCAGFFGRIAGAVFFSDTIATNCCWLAFNCSMLALSTAISCPALARSRAIASIDGAWSGGAAAAGAAASVAAGT